MASNDVVRSPHTPMAESISPTSVVPPSASPHAAPRVAYGLAGKVLGVVDLVTAALVAYGVFEALPARYVPVDAAAVAVIGALASSAIGLLGGRAWGRAAARISAALVLALGLSLIALLAISASYLVGIYDQVGHGGALVLSLVAVLAFPYLVVFPSVQLAWSAGSRERAGEAVP